MFYAFPYVEYNDDGEVTDWQPGMQMRDYLAAQAMKALIYPSSPFTLEHVAASAYAVADAMLRERNRKGGAV